MGKSLLLGFGRGVQGPFGGLGFFCFSFAVIMVPPWPPPQPLSSPRSSRRASRALRTRPDAPRTASCSKRSSAGWRAPSGCENSCVRRLPPTPPSKPGPPCARPPRRRRVSRRLPGRLSERQAGAGHRFPQRGEAPADRRHRQGHPGEDEAVIAGGGTCPHHLATTLPRGFGRGVHGPVGGLGFFRGPGCAPATAATDAPDSRASVRRLRAPCAGCLREVSRMPCGSAR